MSQEVAVIEDAPCDLARVDYTPEFLTKVDQITNDICHGNMTLPKELQDNPANVKVLVYKAFALGIDPVVMLTECNVINGKVGFGAQLIDAAIQSNGLGTPIYEDIGDWGKVNGRRQWTPADEEGLGVKVTFVLKDGTTRDWTCWLSGCTTRNSPNWKSKPNLQLRYQAIKEWARLYAPGVMLGMYSVEELTAAPPQGLVDAIEIKPDQSRADDLKQALGITQPEPEPQPEPQPEPEPEDVIPVEPLVPDEPEEPKSKRVTKTSVMEAAARLNGLGVPDDILNSYLEAKGHIRQGQTYFDAPLETRRVMVNDTEGCATKIKDWYAQSE